MLDELHATDVALISDATIVPASGLTVLTGETGAGKTALLSAVKLAVGERADATSVREGQEALEVEARFFFKSDSDGVVVRRRVGADGRGRVELDGRMASVHELQERVGTSVDLCGQHEHQRLLTTKTHVELIDAYAGEAAIRAKTNWEQALEYAHEAQRELERVREAARASGAQLDDAAFTIRRIDEVNPQEGEYEELEATLPKFEHAETLVRASLGARDAISSDEGARDVLTQAAQRLMDASAFDPKLEDYAEVINRAVIDIEDVASSLRDYAHNIEFEPDELARMQLRFSQLEGLRKSFGPSMEDVFNRYAQAQEAIAAHDAGDERVVLAEQALNKAEVALAAAADELDEVRQKAAPGLTKAITTQMQRLEMGGASVELIQERLERDKWQITGPSHVELMYKPAADLAARPLKRIASGGEVSRVMLAAKVVLGANDSVETLVFDEVDAGVGGATAVALAAVLQDLARSHQVLVVTHLAQVAVVADRHYLVERTQEAFPKTSLTELRGEARVREIARMLSGDSNQASLAHAREMLESNAQ